MERRIMKQGPSTLVVSLPSLWVKKHHVNKGQQIHVTEQGSELHLSLNPKFEDSSITLDMAGTLPMTNRIVGALYKAGYDEITLTYLTGKESSEILRAVPSFTGHEIVNREKNTITIKKLMKEDEETFEALYRKCVHILTDMFQDLVTAFRTGNKEFLDDAGVKDTTLALFADYTRRLLLTGKCEMHTPERYLIIVQLEKLGDRIKHLCALARQQPIKHFASAPTSMALEHTFLFYKEFERLYYSFTMEKLVVWGKEHERLKEEFYQCFVNAEQRKSSKNKTQKNTDVHLLHYISSIHTLLWELNEPLMVMNLVKKKQHS